MECSSQLIFENFKVMVVFGRQGERVDGKREEKIKSRDEAEVNRKSDTDVNRGSFQASDRAQGSLN